jgi:peptidoglycan/LPS O-acetylase OafA/YrhL
VKLPKHIPQLDVLRGAAVLNVMLYHIVDVVPRLHLKPLFGLGYAGVDLFFVLSGFLITGILVDSKDADNYFTNFYARRALRIWPIYYALLLFTFLLLPAIAPALKSAIFERSHPWQAFPFFLQNLTLAGPPFDSVRVTWSLAIEEQFYLVWPVVVWFAPRRILKPLALSGLFLSMAVRWSVLIGLIPALNTYMNTLTRLDGLSLGAFLALWIPEADSRTVKLAGIAAVVLTLPAAIAMGLVRPGHWAFFSLLAACFAGTLCIAINTKALANIPFLKYTGKVSYALYLIHVPVFSVVSYYALGRNNLTRSTLSAEVGVFVLSFAVCYVLAAISWRFFESPFLRLKRRFEYVLSSTSAAPTFYAGAER